MKMSLMNIPLYIMMTVVVLSKQRNVAYWSLGLTMNTLLIIFKENP